MTQELFDVCLTGKVLTGHNRREVTVNLAQLVGTSIPQAEDLLVRASCVKSKVDRATADYYHEVLAETGADVAIRAVLMQSPVVVKPATCTLDPQQAIVEEATPVLEEETFIAPALEDPEPTQPLPSPVKNQPPQSQWRRWRVWVLGGSTVAVLLVAGLLAIPGMLPQPAPPGQALPLVGESLNLVQTYQQQVEQFWRQHRIMPSRPADLHLAGPTPLGTLATVTVSSGGTLILTYSDGAIAGRTLVLTPSPADQGIHWDCTGGTLGALDRPDECRPVAM